MREPEGAVRELTTAEFNLLALFLQKPGRVLSRDELMDLLKGHDWTPMDRSIDALVARLRKKLEPDSERPQLVKTVRGIGYVFAGNGEAASKSMRSRRKRIVQRDRQLGALVGFAQDRCGAAAAGSCRASSAA